MNSVQFQRAVVELAEHLRVPPRIVRKAFCELGHCSCTETPPPVPMVTAKMSQADPEAIDEDWHRVTVSIEAFGRSKEALMAFMGWLEGYLPSFLEDRMRHDADVATIDDLDTRVNRSRD